MSNNTINASMVARMFLGGAKNLEAQKERINELNVFPVPDGDTGTNMTLTIMSAAREVHAMANPTMDELAKAISTGSLRGARGNSGVILSQLLRGFTKGIKGYESLDAVVIANAMVKGVETAYKAVMKPKEGTILTVARGAADKACELAADASDLESFFRAIIAYAQEVLERTPEMLPVLKEAGVVDSGGQGLVAVYQGILDAYLGKEIAFDAEEPEAAGGAQAAVPKQAEAEIKFGYCTEFIIMLEKKYDDKKEKEFKDYLESIGDSIVVVSDEDIVKVHVHTNDPGLAIQKALTYGSLTRMKIDNMREEHQEKLIKDAQKVAAQQKAAEGAQKGKGGQEASKEKEAPKEKEPMKEYGFIAVSIGDGIGEIFKSLGVDCLIEGGQTMNPSTEDMLNAIEAVNANNIFILPNNKNIILAANQAQSLTKDKNIFVIPTKTVPQGITALINFTPDQPVEENAQQMMECIEAVKTGQVTYAVRDTKIDDKEIHEGDIMGIGDKSILSVGRDILETTKDMVSQMTDENTELISVYYGEETKESEAMELKAYLEEKYPDCDIDVHSGGQPIYYYVVSVE